MIPDRSKFTVVHVTAFQTVQQIADAYRDGASVDIMLDATSADIGRRAVDFASGVAYGTGGRLEKVDVSHFRLSPAMRATSARPGHGYPPLGPARHRAG